MKTLFPIPTRPYFILAPAWTHISSGVRTLHLLCHALNSIGQRAYIALQSHGSLNPALLTPPLMKEIAESAGDDFIAVYPDVARGNPLNAKRVVRYLLAPAGKYGGDAVFPETDLVYSVLPSISPNLLRIPVSDIGIFYKPPIERRHGSCFYAHKYDRIHGQQLLPLTTGSTRLEGSLHALANILRKSEVCYLYELTSVITEAALCGCPVELIRTPYFNSIDPAAMMGNVKWNDGEIVRQISGDYLPEYTGHINNFWHQLDRFVADTQGMK